MRNMSSYLKILLTGLILFGTIGCAFEKEKEVAPHKEEWEKDEDLVVQLAELEIDPNQLDAYLELLEEEIRTSIKTEPGVLSLYAMADKEQPNKISIVEIYANQEAYSAHITSPHFLKYKNGTSEMVTSLILTRTLPVVFAAKD